MIEAVEAAKKSAKDNMQMFLRNFSHVPDDRLQWTPVPTAKSALRIAVHTALYYSRFAKMIRDRKPPQPEDLELWIAQNNAEEEAITTREQVIQAFNKGLEEVISALETIQADEVDSEIDSGQGWTMSMRFMMNLPGWHATLHCGQIDYLQTCWNDQEIYVG